MGRVKAKRETIAPTGSGLVSMTNSISYNYNVDGSVQSLTYPSGRTINYTYNQSQRTLSMVDANTSIYRNFVTNAHYNAPGMLTSANHGDGITDSNNFNNRLQLLLLSTSSRTQTLLNLSYVWSQTGFPNNGTVQQILNGIRNPGSNRSFAYSYDQVNRLQTAGTISTATSPGLRPTPMILGAISIKKSQPARVPPTAILISDPSLLIITIV
jgi:YD repeat-containing protein